MKRMWRDCKEAISAATTADVKEWVIRRVVKNACPHDPFLIAEFARAIGIDLSIVLVMHAEARGIKVGVRR